MQGEHERFAAGRVEHLARWPVKSFAGEPIAAAMLDECGFAGDRTFALVDVDHPRRRLLTARTAPRMVLWSASYPDHPDDRLQPGDPQVPALVSPGGRRLAWDDPALPALLAEDLGREVELRRDRNGQHDEWHTVLVTVEASRAALEREWGRPVDLRRFRTNVHLTLDAPPFAEAAWTGGRLVVGDCELDFLEPCRRCTMIDREPDDAGTEPTLRRLVFDLHDGFFGIYARARGTGGVRLGAPASAFAP